MEITEIKSLIDAQGRAWEEFKASNDERIKAEAKGIADTLFDAKAAKLNETLDAVTVQIKAMELKAARPGVGVDADNNEHKEAFRNFMTKGTKTGLDEIEKKTFSIGSSADGGYAVPKVIDASVEKLAVNISPIRMIAKVITIGTNDYHKLVNLNGTTSGWVAETAARTGTSTPQLADITISPYELYVNAASTQPALDDPQFDMESWLMDNVYEEFMRAEAASFVNGTGSGQPTGFLNGTPLATADGARAFGSLQYVPSGVAGGMPTSLDTFINLVGAMKVAYLAGAVWVVNKGTLASLRTFKTTQNEYLWQPSLQAGIPAQFLGYDVVQAEDMPAVAANSFPIAFGNFQRGYQIVDRADVRMLRDPYSNKPYINFYGVKRVGGKVINSETIKLLKASVS
jgi:HK97 family phage major capsid protein